MRGYIGKMYKWINRIVKIIWFKKTKDQLSKILMNLGGLKFLLK